MRAVGDAAVDAGWRPAAVAAAVLVAADGNCSKFALMFDDGLAANCSACGDAAADESANRLGLSCDRMPT